MDTSHVLIREGTLFALWLLNYGRYCESILSYEQHTTDYWISTKRSITNCSGQRTLVQNKIISFINDLYAYSSLIRLDLDLVVRFWPEIGF